MHTYAYNESGLMAEDIYYTPVYTVENDKWHAETKRNYDYDANGNRILDISF